MEIKKNAGLSLKGQLFSLTALVFILLMIITLLVFVIMSIGYDNLSQASILSTSSTNFGSLLSKSSSSFAYSTGQAAMSTLFEYESNSVFRKSNFVSNTSQYLQYLIVNGSLPNVVPNSATANYLYYLMGNATFLSYNSVISSQTGLNSKQVSITESKPQVFQASPYTLNIRYIEDVIINTSSGVYSFTIPVNASVPINNTPDLFYAQQGLYRPITFSSIQSSVSVIGDDYATSGTSTGVAYGTIFQIPPGALNCNAVTSGLRSAPFSNSIILVTSNAFGITTGAAPCANNYGGLITTIINNPPSVPYLLFAQNANVIPYLQTGQPVLLYGPGLAALNETNFINTASSGSYFTSPFATSYFDRVSGNFAKQSQNGIFTFFEANRQAASFNGFAQISTPEPQSSITTYTVAAWVYPSPNGVIEATTTAGSASHSLTLGFGNTINCGNPDGTFFFGDYGAGLGIGVNTLSVYPANTWYFVAGTFNATGAGAVQPSQFTIYVNGNVAPSSATWCKTLGSDSVPVTSADPVVISPKTSYAASNFIGSIANMQIYGQALTQSQIYQLYQAGIEAVPISNSVLLGWYTLNGNSNDYSGNGYTTTPTSVAYSLLHNYKRDSIFVRPIPGNVFPVPGLLTCSNNRSCNNLVSTSVYMGDIPLSISNGGFSTAYFNGYKSNIIVSGIIPTSNVISVSGWINLQSPSNTQFIAQSGNFMLTYNYMGAKEFDYFININGGLNTPVVTPYAPSVGQWYMVTGTFGPDPLSPANNNCLKLYINGAAANSICSTGMAMYSFLSAGPLPMNSQQTFIGSNSGLYYLNGSLSNLQIYNTTLSANEVSTLYSQGITSPPVDTQHIVAWYPLYGNANDISGYGNSGTPSFISYRLIASNYSGYYTYNSIGLPTQGSVTNEWQTVGFPAHP